MNTDGSTTAKGSTSAAPLLPRRLPRCAHDGAAVMYVGPLSPSATRGRSSSASKPLRTGPAATIVRVGEGAMLNLLSKAQGATKGAADPVEVREM